MSEYHLLQRGGRFIIINRYPKEGTKWHDFVQIKSESEYVHVLKEAGFEQIDIKLKEGPDKITVIAQK